jgi:hypothetical protein
MKYLIEIATSDFLTTKSAVKAAQIERALRKSCRRRYYPSYAHIKKCREAFDIAFIPDHSLKRR